VRLILGVPSGPGPHPAVIFNHGTGVRHLGYEGSKNRGQMDVSRFTDALVHDGYVALAPIQPFNSDTAYVERGGKVGSEQDWTEVVERGIDTVKAALVQPWGQNRQASRGSRQFLNSKVGSHREICGKKIMSSRPMT
jgi:dienelactone hydrolase